MNSVSLIGRLTRDPDVRYGGENQTAIARFSIAIDRMPGRNGEKQTDFPNIVCFGKTAELVERYMSKGRLVGVTGRLQTGSYTNKEGQKVFTTEVVADRVEFLDRGDRTEGGAGFGGNAPQAPSGHNAGGFGGNAPESFGSNAPEGFNQLTEDDIPF